MEEENEKTENNVVVTTLNTDGKVMQLFLPTEEETVDGNSSVTTLEALPSGGVLNSSGIEVITLNPGEQHLHITEVTPDVTTDLRLKDTEASALLSEDTPADELTENDNDNVTTSDTEESNSELTTLNMEVSSAPAEAPTALTLTDMGIGQALQIVNLPDGTTAMIQSYPKAALSPDGKGSTTQTVQLPDGTTAILQSMPALKVGENLQTVQLEDGTTAYIAHMNTESLLTEAGNMDVPGISLDHLTQQISRENSQPEVVANNGAAIKVEDASLPTVSLSGGLPQSQLSSERALALGDKAYQCRYPGCGRLYTTLHHLKVHERSHTGDRPFKCDFVTCGKAFATGYGLKSHIRVHTGEKPYRCPDENCTKAFKTSGDLQKHIRTHTGERPFKCPFEGCDRAFTTSNIRKVHIRTHTGERPYVCNASGCMKSFASATNYKNHIRIHTGEKPYVCTVENCGKRFTEYSSLYKHHVVHTHSKPYICGHCGKNYRQTSTLAMHKRTVHGEDTTPEQEAALLLQASEDLAPPSKQPRLHQVQVANLGGITANGTEEEEGTLVINTSEVPQVTMVTSDGLPVSMSSLVSEDGSLTGLHMSQQAAHATIQQLAQGQGLTLAASSDSEQQILVVTDPAQVEALQQLAAQQFYQTSEAADTENASSSESNVETEKTTTDEL